MNDDKTLPPKVFISYSWTSPTHQDFVISLAERLCSHGVDVILDKWYLSEGQDKYAFMEKMVTDSKIKKVLIISDKQYAEKADNRKGGVGTESQIISNEVYNKVEQTKFIPIVAEFNEEGEPCLPIFLKSRIYIDLSNNDIFYTEYDRLLRNILDKPEISRPRLGVPPKHITEQKPITIKTTSKHEAFIHALINEKNTVQGLLRDYLDSIESIYPELLINEELSTNIDDQVLDSIIQFKPYRDQLVDVVKHIVCYSENRTLYEILFEFLQKVANYHYTLKNVRNFCENYKFINYELFLYIITIFIKYNKYDILDFFLDRKYYIPNGYDEEFTTFHEFNNHYIKSLDEHRNKRLGLKRISVTADLIKDRADVKTIAFEEIIQADLILCIRGISQAKRWFPKTLVYNISTPPELFRKAKEKRNFEILKQVLKISSSDDLIMKINQHSNFYRLSEWPLDFLRLLNLNDLNTV